MTDRQKRTIIRTLQQLDEQIDSTKKDINVVLYEGNPRSSFLAENIATYSARLNGFLQKRSGILACLGFLDCRIEYDDDTGHVVDIIDMREECCPDMCVEIVSIVTDGDPLADLTLADAERLIKKADNMGFIIPKDLTPENFLKIYEDLKPGE